MINCVAKYVALLLSILLFISPSVYAKNIIVAADGSGDYKTVQDAVNAAQSGIKGHPTIIYIKPR